MRGTVRCHLCKNSVTFAMTVGFAIGNAVVRVLLVDLAVGLVLYIFQLPAKPPGPAGVTGDASGR